MTVSEYDNWRDFCNNTCIDNFLYELCFPLFDILQVYFHRVLHGHYSKKISFRTDMVSLAWRAIAMTNVLEDRTDPPKHHGSTSWDLDLCLSCYLQTPLGIAVAASKGSSDYRTGQCLGKLIKLRCILSSLL